MKNPKRKKVNSVSDLEELRDSIARSIDTKKTVVKICSTTGCRAGGAAKIINILTEEVTKQGLDDKVEIKKVGCRGFCEKGPLLVLGPKNIFYQKLKPADIPEVVSETLAKGIIVDRLLYEDPDTKEKIKYESDIPFFKKQMRNVFGRTGKIDPTNIEDYISCDGYSALCKALTSRSPEDIINTISDSGLRGRGGGGFPAGTKWKFCRNAAGDIKYIIANGDEGDPGAFMDRSLMEGDPHSILEGMIIGAYAIGATEGCIYVRAEYPLAVKHLGIAIKDAEEYGFLGKNIFGSGFDFKIKIKTGAGAFVCGEETALLQSIMGKRGTPVPRPPFPAVEGLWGKPTVINNVKSWTNVALIIKNGADWFSSIGTEKSKGTTIFSVVGMVKNTGLVEVPMGTTLRDIIFGCANGIQDNKSLKAVQIGGPAGGCIPAELIDTPVDFDRLVELGAMMGSGGMVVMDENTCMVDVARYFLAFTQSESCGKCAPCRIGTKVMLDILDKIRSGNGEEEDLEKLEDLATTISNASLCGLGQLSPNPILSTLRYFRSEYEAHIIDKSCPALVCKDLIKYAISEEKCAGCGICQKKCPAGAITGKKKEAHIIDESICVKCGICYQVCPSKYGAVEKITGFLKGH
ncbi:MAG: 4Fe-4S binding protein [Deltaproteobacteria bacterium]|nr:4Fe-4S binding protein [Deltaproteobacteria bacterium]MBW2661801.1 4Fe-4S binding protein [Deltaproteobacteria bacterium]